MWLLIDGAELANRGSWPKSGGWLDQADCFVEGVREVKAAQAFWRQAMMNG